jgi:phospholipase/carboxylesterase
MRWWSVGADRGLRAIGPGEHDRARAAWQAMYGRASMSRGLTMALLSGPRLPPRRPGPPRQLVVLLHGVGADGNDLIGLAPALARHLPHAAFVAPDGPEPCDMAPFGRQWFSLRDRRPAALLAGVQASLPVLDAFLDGELEDAGLGPRQLALVGFSQGTMLALYAALRRAPAIAAVLGYSGALLGAERLGTDVVSRPPVFLVHGDADEIVPVQALHAAVEGLQAAEVPVRWAVRRGLGHGIDPESIEHGAAFLAAAFGDAEEGA